jgi:uncharacterized sporulation protein YeaH/YhbH (DUF444 family)
MKRPSRRLTRSTRRHIRAEKAKIRQIADEAVRAQKLTELYAKFGVTVDGRDYAG